MSCSTTGNSSSPRRPTRELALVATPCRGALEAISPKPLTFSIILIRFMNILREHPPTGAFLAGRECIGGCRLI
jgi:hypothetical protein